MKEPDPTVRFAATIATPHSSLLLLSLYDTTNVTESCDVVPGDGCKQSQQNGGWMMRGLVTGTSPAVQLYFSPVRIKYYVTWTSAGKGL